ncbi:MAG: hypothetical protein AAFR16_04510 [Pseudomonadota bacterium]
MTMKLMLASAATLLVSAQTALAQSKPGAPTVVPEIDALAGVAALAVVGATVALVRERTKRR